MKNKTMLNQISFGQKMDKQCISLLVKRLDKVASINVADGAITIIPSDKP